MAAHSKLKPKSRMKPCRIYSARRGSPYNDKDARIIGPILEDIEAGEGMVLPESVIDRAKPPSSPIHKFFDWDDSSAAEKYRMEQARGLIRAVVIKVYHQPNRRPIRGWYCVTNPETKQKGYVTIDKVVTIAAYQRQVVEDALLELEGWRERYKQYRELQDIVDAIDKFLARARKKRGRSKKP